MTDIVTDSVTSGPYRAQTHSEAHLQELLTQLPRMQEVQARLEAHHEAGQLLSRWTAVDDLEGDIEDLQAKDPERDGIDPGLYDLLLREKRSSLGRERTRFAHDLAQSRFANVPEASRARIPADEARELEDKLNRYREDYAYTLARCQTDAAR